MYSSEVHFPTRHGCLTFPWPRDTTVIVGWSAGCTWKNNNNWYIWPPKLLYIFIVHTVFTKVAASCTIQPGRLQDGAPHYYSYIQSQRQSSCLRCLAHLSLLVELWLYVLSSCSCSFFSYSWCLPCCISSFVKLASASPTT